VRASLVCKSGPDWRIAAKLESNPSSEGVQRTTTVCEKALTTNVAREDLGLSEMRADSLRSFHADVRPRVSILHPTGGSSFHEAVPSTACEPRRYYGQHRPCLRGSRSPAQSFLALHRRTSGLGRKLKLSLECWIAPCENVPVEERDVADPVHQSCGASVLSRNENLKDVGEDLCELPTHHEVQ